MPVLKFSEMVIRRILFSVENFIFIGGYRVVCSQNCYLWFIVDITAQGTLFVSFFKNSERVILFTYRTGRRGLDPLRRHNFLQ